MIYYMLTTRNLVMILCLQRLNDEWLSTIAKHKLKWLSKARPVELLQSLKIEISQLS
jgi:hypothetical protein